MNREPQVSPAEGSRSLPCPRCEYPLEDAAQGVCPECGRSWSDARLSAYWVGEYRSTEHAAWDFAVGAWGFGVVGAALVLAPVVEGRVSGPEIGVILFFTGAVVLWRCLSRALRARLRRWSERPVRTTARLRLTADVVYGLGVLLGLCGALAIVMQAATTLFT